MPSTGERNDPFIAFRFEVLLDDISAGGFSECSGLSMETEVQDYMEGGLNSHTLKFPTRSKQANITLKRGIVGTDLWQWYYDLTQGQIIFREGTIVVHPPAGEGDDLIWHFTRAYPCKWQGPELNALQSNVAVETLELCHHGLRRER